MTVATPSCLLVPSLKNKTLQAEPAQKLQVALQAGASLAKAEAVAMLIITNRNCPAPTIESSSLNEIVSSLPLLTLLMQHLLERLRFLKLQPAGLVGSVGEPAPTGQPQQPMQRQQRR
jgi:hypothetical protein